MDRYGYVKVAAVSPKNVYIGSPGKNVENIKKLAEEAANLDAEVIVFPELCITGYTCGDLFYQKSLLDEAEAGLYELVKYSLNKNILNDVVLIVGVPLRKDNQLFNCAAIISNGKIIAVIPKTHIPNYNEFYEMRYFSSSQNAASGMIHLGTPVPFGTDIIVKCTNCENNSFLIGTEICEDAWAPITPGARHCIAGADIIANLSASNELTSKRAYRRNLVSSLSAQEISGYIYTSASCDESANDTVYSGHCIVCENGKILGETKFLDGQEIITADIDVERLRTDRMKSTSYMQYTPPGDYKIIALYNWRARDSYYTKNNRTVSLTPFVPKNIKERAEEILAIQAAGLAQKLKKSHIKKAVIGISGGLDSTLALLATIKAFEIAGLDRKGIIGITMPCFGTTKRTKNNSIELMNYLNITSRTIDIKKACEQHLKDIGHPDNVYDITYENVQARERTQVLMDVANMEGAIVIGTGDLSEAALGWCTYNGDHMSMYGVNSSIPKTLVRHLVAYYRDLYEESGKDNDTSKLTAECIQSILDTPVSPELLPPNKDGTIAQKTEDSIGNYNIHDFTLYYTIRFGFGPAKIMNLFMNSAKNDPEWKNITEKEVLDNMKTFYRRFTTQQFKRNCVPDGIKVGSISLSPRADWRMPSDADMGVWVNELVYLENEIEKNK